MKAHEIDAAMSAYRAEEMRKINFRVGHHPAFQGEGRMADEMRALDQRAATYAASLGVPDDQPDEPPQTPPAASPGSKVRS